MMREERRRAEALRQLATAADSVWTVEVGGARWYVSQYGMFRCGGLREDGWPTFEWSDRDAPTDPIRSLVGHDSSHDHRMLQVHGPAGPLLMDAGDQLVAVFEREDGKHVLVGTAYLDIQRALTPVMDWYQPGDTALLPVYGYTAGLLAAVLMPVRATSREGHLEYEHLSVPFEVTDG